MSVVDIVFVFKLLYIGSVYVYSTSDYGQTWSEVQKLGISGQAFEYFGCSLAAEVDILVVGAYKKDGGKGQAVLYLLVRLCSAFNI